MSACLQSSAATCSSSRLNMTIEHVRPCGICVNLRDSRLITLMSQKKQTCSTSLYSSHTVCHVGIDCLTPACSVQMITSGSSPFDSACCLLDGDDDVAAVAADDAG